MHLLSRRSSLVLLLALLLASLASALDPARPVGDLAISQDPTFLYASKLTALGDSLYFWGGPQGGRVRDLGGEELWVSDGTATGTHLLFDAGQNRLYFTFPDRRYGMSLWTSDGTEAGTRRLAAIPGEGIAFPDTLRADDRLTAVFEGRLWTSDGTPGGPASWSTFRLSASPEWSAPATWPTGKSGTGILPGITTAFE